MDKLLLEYPWLPKVVQLSKDYGLDWLMMAAMALELSGGDPRCRIIDREFLYDHLGPDSPLVSGQWEQGFPRIEVIDMATRWGLFQILGRVAIEKGIFTGRMINFTDIGANTRAACQIVNQIIQAGGTENDAIKYFGLDPKKIKSLMDESRHSVTILLNISEIEELEEA